MDRARERAENAWHQLRLRGGWNPAALTLYPDQVKARFGKPSRPVQHDAVTLAAQIPVPGLLIVEAPMGEGKTEAALAAVEVFASRFGADGVFVGMPTQATSDPMFSRVREWAEQIGSWESNLMTEWHQRYGGPGVMIYWHVERRSVCIYSQLKSCSSSEVAAMIEGLLRHCTDTNIDTSYVDTHGASVVGTVAAPPVARVVLGGSRCGAAARSPSPSCSGSGCCRGSRTSARSGSAGPTTSTATPRSGRY
jgi:hypothetical protein